MPRNVVTLIPRWRPWMRSEQERVLEALATRYRYRRDADSPGVEIDFPKSKGRALAKDEVGRVLDNLNPKWRRIFVLYPTENSLGRTGRGRS